MWTRQGSSTNWRGPSLRRRLARRCYTPPKESPPPAARRPTDAVARPASPEVLSPQALGPWARCLWSRKERFGGGRPLHLSLCSTRVCGPGAAERSSWHLVLPPPAPKVISRSMPAGSRLPLKWPDKCPYNRLLAVPRPATSAWRRSGAPAHRRSVASATSDVAIIVERWKFTNE